MISPEADRLLEAWRTNHRINILLTLKPHGHMPGKEVTMGIWGWDQR